MIKKLVIIGGVAAGPKVALKAKREHPDLDVILITQEEYTAYSGCGLPYYIGGVLSGKESVIIKEPDQLRSQFGLTVLSRHRVDEIGYDDHQVYVTDLNRNEHRAVPYDRLVIATGASPVVPPALRCEAANLFTLRSVEDGFQIRAYIEQNTVGHITIIGGAFIGLELAENLKRLEKRVTIIELSNQLLASFDKDVSNMVRNIVVENGVNVFLEESVTALGLSNDCACIEKVVTDKRTVATDLVVVATGVRPNTGFLDESRIRLSANKAIVADKQQRTTCPDIYAVGDCAENINLITGGRCWFPMGSTANKAGRVCGINVADPVYPAEFPGVAGTMILRLFSENIGKTGLSEKEAARAGVEYECVTVGARNIPKHFPGSDHDVIKLIARKSDGRILGMQSFGRGPVDKYVDTVAAAMYFGASADDLQYLDLAYSPLFATPISAVNLAASVLKNKADGLFQTISAEELHRIMTHDDVELIDVRSQDEYAQGHIPNSSNVDFLDLVALRNLPDKSKQICLICESAKRAYVASRYLTAAGFSRVKVLDGGLLMWPYQKVSLY